MRDATVTVQSGARDLSMKCRQCQHENSAKAKFCEECAAPLPRTCDNCGSQVSLTAKYCPQCSHPLSPVRDDPRFASPKNYTPQHLANKILTSRTALEGERKQVTVLFADIKGSMELLADRDPRTWWGADDPRRAYAQGRQTDWRYYPLSAGSSTVH